MKKSEALQIAKPIRFDKSMKPVQNYLVNKILENQKTVLRQVIKPRPIIISEEEAKARALSGLDPYGFRVGVYTEREMIKKLPYQKGDLVYVQEIWEKFDCENCDGGLDRVCDKEPVNTEPSPHCYMYKATDTIWGDAEWHPPYLMPVEAARIFLRVDKVYIECLQDITEEGAINEGCPGIFLGDGSAMGSGWEKTPTEQFAEIWDSLISPEERLGEYGWEGNPFVWVIEFTKEEVEK